MRGPGITDAILNGHSGAQMPEFADRISADDVERLSSYLTTPLPEPLIWEREQVVASLALDSGYVAGNSPILNADPLNITVVVEASGNRIAVMDGDSFEILDRFESPPVVPGALQFSPDGRFAFILSRDGWILKYDLWALHSVGRVRTGLSSSALALSHDGKWLTVANDLPNTLTFLNTRDLTFAGTIPLVGKDETPSRVSSMYLAPLRNRFVLALRDVSEIWEVFYGPNPPFYGFVHDYRIEGPPAIEEPFPVRRITRVDFLDGFFFDQTYEYIIGSSKDGDGGFVVDLVIGQKVADLDLRGDLFAGNGAAWEHRGSAVLAAPQMSGNSLSVINAKSWKTIKFIKTEGPGSFIKNHRKSAFIWADVFSGGERKALHVIDKQSLEIVRTIRVDQGAVIADLAFASDGSTVFVSLQRENGALVVYDARSLEEIKRLPMRSPRGIFNASNSIRPSHTE